MDTTMPYTRIHNKSAKQAQNRALRRDSSLSLSLVK